MTGVAWYINDMKRKHEHAVRVQVLVMMHSRPPKISQKSISEHIHVDVLILLRLAGSSYSRCQIPSKRKMTSFFHLYVIKN